MDQTYYNEMYLEGMKEDFFSALKDEDVHECESIIKELKGQGINTGVLELDLISLENQLKSSQFEGVEYQAGQDMTRETYHNDSLSSQAESYGGY